MEKKDYNNQLIFQWGFFKGIPKEVVQEIFDRLPNEELLKKIGSTNKTIRRFALEALFTRETLDHKTIAFKTSYLTSLLSRPNDSMSKPFIQWLRSQLKIGKIPLDSETLALLSLELQEKTKDVDALYQAAILDRGAMIDIYGLKALQSECSFFDFLFLIRRNRSLFSDDIDKKIFLYIEQGFSQFSAKEVLLFFKTCILPSLKEPESSSENYLYLINSMKAGFARCQPKQITDFLKQHIFPLLKDKNTDGSGAMACIQAAFECLPASQVILLLESNIVSSELSVSDLLAYARIQFKYLVADQNQGKQALSILESIVPLLVEHRIRYNSFYTLECIDIGFKYLSGNQIISFLEAHFIPLLSDGNKVFSPRSAFEYLQKGFEYLSIAQAEPVLALLRSHIASEFQLPVSAGFKCLSANQIMSFLESDIAPLINHKNEKISVKGIDYAHEGFKYLASDQVLIFLESYIVSLLKNNNSSLLILQRAMNCIQIGFEYLSADQEKKVLLFLSNYIIPRFNHDNLAILVRAVECIQTAFKHLSRDHVLSLLQAYIASLIKHDKGSLTISKKAIDCIKEGFKYLSIDQSFSLLQFYIIPILKIENYENCDLIKAALIFIQTYIAKFSADQTIFILKACAPLWEQRRDDFFSEIITCVKIGARRLQMLNSDSVLILLQNYIPSILSDEKMRDEKEVLNLIEIYIDTLKNAEIKDKKERIGNVLDFLAQCLPPTNYFSYQHRVVSLMHMGIQNLDDVDKSEKIIFVCDFLNKRKDHTTNLFLFLLPLLNDINLKFNLLPRQRQQYATLIENMLRDFSEENSDMRYLRFNLLQNISSQNSVFQVGRPAGFEELLLSEISKNILLLDDNSSEGSMPYTVNERIFYLPASAIEMLELVNSSKPVTTRLEEIFVFASKLSESLSSNDLFTIKLYRWIRKTLLNVVGAKALVDDILQGILSLNNVMRSFFGGTTVIYRGGAYKLPDHAAQMLKLYKDPSLSSLQLLEQLIAQAVNAGEKDRHPRVSALYMRIRNINLNNLSKPEISSDSVFKKS